MALRLEFAGSSNIEAPRETVWHRLTDLAFVVRSVPGVESARIVTPNHYQLVSTLGFGLFKLRLTTDVENFDFVPPEQARLRAVVQAAGSTMHVTSLVRLEAIATGDTLLHWTATTEMDGMLAGLGSRAEGAARKFTSDFWLDFARRVEAER